jgi:hypothetical protein
LAASAFRIHVTSWCASASRLISRTVCRETGRSQPCWIPCAAKSPITVQLPRGLPQPWPATCMVIRHWHWPTPKTVYRSRTTSRRSDGSAIGCAAMVAPTDRTRTNGAGRVCPC